MNSVSGRVMDRIHEVASGDPDLIRAETWVNAAGAMRPCGTEDAGSM